MVRVSINKFDGFMTSMGYQKSVANTRVMWKHPNNINLDFSYNSDSEYMHFYGEHEGDHTPIYCLGLVEPFKQYFKIAA